MVWPEYNVHGNVARQLWARLEELPEFQFVLYDDEADEILAEGHSIPCRWDGTATGLPDGIDGLMTEAFALLDEGREANTLSALAIEIQPGAQGRGLSRTMVDAMGTIAREHGFHDLIAPVRPSRKDRYPLTPIERYAVWTDGDGLPFDPWMRVHARLGGEILRCDPQSLRIEAPVADWEAWVGMPFPESGTYVFPQGLAPLHVDREADVGRYFEPNVWMRHRLGD